MSLQLTTDCEKGSDSVSLSSHSPSRTRHSQRQRERERDRKEYNKKAVKEYKSQSCSTLHAILAEKW
jgi:hypothetical protein